MIGFANLIVDLPAMDTDFGGSHDAQTNAITTDPQDAHFDAVPNHDSFVPSSGEDQHVGSYSASRRTWRSG